MAKQSRKQSEAVMLFFTEAGITEGFWVVSWNHKFISFGKKGGTSLLRVSADWVWR